MDTIVARLFLIASLVLIVAVVWGRRYNIQLANEILGVLKLCFRPRNVETAVLGRGLGYGIDYEVDGAFPNVQVILTLLPRYAPLYLPIAHLIGRRDLLKLTFSGTSLPTGIGFLLRDHGAARLPVEPDREMFQEEVWVDKRRYWVCSFNSHVSQRLQRIAPYLAPVDSFQELILDSRSGTVTVFLFPDSRTLSGEVYEIRIAVDLLLE